ncbi:MAG: hypothetical protein ABR573_09000 [Candidatus Dormibacteria bacterium]
MRRGLLVACALVALVAGCGQRTSTTLLELDSQNDAQSPPFTAQHAWQLAYSWNCAQDISEGRTQANRFAYTVYYAEDHSTATENYQLNKTGKSGKGTVRYNRNGIYFIKVQSDCHWKVTVTPQGASPPA